MGGGGEVGGKVGGEEGGEVGGEEGGGRKVAQERGGDAGNDTVHGRTATASQHYTNHMDACVYMNAPPPLVGLAGHTSVEPATAESAQSVEGGGEDGRGNKPKIPNSHGLTCSTEGTITPFSSSVSAKLSAMPLRPLNRNRATAAGNASSWSSVSVSLYASVMFRSMAVSFWPAALVLSTLHVEGRAHF